MSIAQKIKFYSNTDEIVGLSHTSKNIKPANQALTFMVRSLSGKWKQPFGYFFSHNSCSAINLERFVNQSIEKIIESGFFVKQLFVTSLLSISN